ncbi:MAG: V-type ATP synthase subunit I [Kiritimatiellia bacterium]
MIVPMQHLDLLCIAAEKTTALEALRALGAVHLDLAAARGAEVQGAREDIAAAEKAVRLIQKARGKDHVGVQVATEVPAVLRLAEEIESCRSEADALAREIAKLEPYGDFDPDLARRLLEKGVDIRAVADFPDPLPRKGLRALQTDLAALESEITVLTSKLAVCDDGKILAGFPGLADHMAFVAAKELMSDRGAVACIAGWVPEPKIAALKTAAAANGWGLLLREPNAAENPPTLVEPPRFFRPMKALFDGLGIAPAYTEADVSVPFMCYFSLFFAMLVGDGAYGAIFLAGTLAARKRLPRAWFVLMMAFSLATVLWGVLSNTWFGAQLPFLASLPTAQWLADPSYHHMMLLCFTIGVSHLMLARIWNGICRAPDSTSIAEFGWAGILLFMYLVTNAIIGIFPGIPTWAYYVFGVSLAAIFGFTVKPRELKTRGAELGMLPLNIMSALGDIISYVRLFAVGLASVKVAENFNSMATGLVASEHSLGLNILMSVAMVLILVIGHGLNLAMAGLSVLVHAVRLNTLEFSNHKGVSWAGYAFNAFRKTKGE